jgi:preprotein translocase subunit SecE
MNAINYIVESFKELQSRVTWLSWGEAQNSTLVVAVFTVLFALAIFFADKFFQFGLDSYFSLFN